jgi:hypothetical protein
MFKTRLKSTVAAIALLASLGSANAMTFSQQPVASPDLDVFAQGEIVDGDAARLATFLRTLPATGGTTYLDLNSPGGDVGEAFEMAKVIANSRASTVIHSGGSCASACFWMFAAGQRLWMSNNARLGVHSPSDARTGTETSEGTVDLARLSHKLGIPDSIVVAMINTPPDDMTWLTPNQLAEMGVTVIPDRVTAMASPPAPSYTPAPASLPAPAPAYAPAPAVPHAASADPTQAFMEGANERRAYEAWFASLAEGSQFKQGALYWASMRSTKNAAVGCVGPGYTGTADQQQWVAGCQNAKAILAPSDYRRLTNPAYRAGWNSIPDTPA